MKYVKADWHRRPDGRRWRFRHNRLASSLYFQLFRLELVVWYR